MIEVDYKKHIIIKIQLEGEDANNFIIELTNMSVEGYLSNEDFTTLSKIFSELSNK